MKPAKTRKLGALEAGNRAKDARLLAVLELGLEPHHVEQRAEPIILAQLNDGARLDVRRMAVGQAEGLHRSVTQSLTAALRHHLDRQAAVEVGRFPVVESDLLAAEQGIDERLVLFARERAIDVRCVRAAGARLVVARLQPSARHVDRVAVNNRSDRIEEG